MRVENGIVVGSNGKYDTRNPLARYLLSRFDCAIIDSVREAMPSSVLEVGCGEGHVTRLILGAPVISVLATDISQTLIVENRMKISDPRVRFESIDLMSGAHSGSFDAVVCCEVLEHLEDPVRALKILRELGANNYIFSVPREPIWRIMNFCRGAYMSDFGNSPGHINHYSRSGFLKLIGSHFVVKSLRSPLPWTVVRCQIR